MQDFRLGPGKLHGSPPHTHLLLRRGRRAHRSGASGQRTIGSAAAAMVTVQRGDSGSRTKKALPACPRSPRSRRGSRVPQQAQRQVAEVSTQNQQAGKLGLSRSSSALSGPHPAIWDSGHCPAEGGPSAGSSHGALRAGLRGPAC